MNALLRHLMILIAAASFLQAEESFDSLVEKLADDQFAVRAAAQKELVAMCRKKPALLDRLAPIAFDEKDDIERVLNVREVIAAALYVERGAVGFALNRELIVERLVKNGPAQQSGIELGYQLLSVAGKEVKDRKTPAEIYSMIHATRPGTPMEMEFLTPDGEKLLLQPKPVPRSTIRSDENPEQRRKEVYEEWMEKKRKELQLEAD